jgi:hypothetical protein
MRLRHSSSCTSMNVIVALRGVALRVPQCCVLRLLRSRWPQHGFLPFSLVHYAQATITIQKLNTNCSLVNYIIKVTFCQRYLSNEKSKLIIMKLFFLFKHIEQFRKYLQSTLLCSALLGAHLLLVHAHVRIPAHRGRDRIERGNDGRMREGGKGWASPK